MSEQPEWASYSRERHESERRVWRPDPRDELPDPAEYIDQEVPRG